MTVPRVPYRPPILEPAAALPPRRVNWRAVAKIVIVLGAAVLINWLIWRSALWLYHLVVG